MKLFHFKIIRRHAWLNMYPCNDLATTAVSGPQARVSGSRESRAFTMSHSTEKENETPEATSIGIGLVLDI